MDCGGESCRRGIPHEVRRPQEIIAHKRDCKVEVK